MEKKKGYLIILIIGILTVQSVGLPKSVLGSLPYNYTTEHGDEFIFNTLITNGTTYYTNETINLTVNWTISDVKENENATNPITSDSRVIIHTYNNCPFEGRGTDPGIILWSSDIKAIITK